MEFIGADKEVAGFSIDYMRAAGKEAGFTPVFTATPWEVIFAGLTAGKYDAICSSLSITSERQSAVNFSIPYFTVRQVLVVPEASTAKSLADMKGKTLGAQISTTGHFAVKKAEGVRDKFYDEVDMAFEDLANGRIDGVVCDDPVAAEYVLQIDKYKGRFKMAAVLQTDEDEHYAVAVRKGDPATLELINKGIAAVQAKGIDKELIQRWIGR